MVKIAVLALIAVMLSSVSAFAPSHLGRTVVHRLHRKHTKNDQEFQNMSTVHFSARASPQRSNREHNNAQPTMTSSNTDARSVDFVRGAAMASSVEEIMLNPQSRAISFRTRDNVRINVYYTARTIGTAMDHPAQGKTQLFPKKCTSQELEDILANPRIHTGRGYKRRSQKRELKIVHQTQHGPEVLLEQEEKRRSALSFLEVEEKIGKLWKMSMTLLTSLVPL